LGPSSLKGRNVGLVPSIWRQVVHTKFFICIWNYTTSHSKRPCCQYSLRENLECRKDALKILKTLLIINFRLIYTLMLLWLLLLVNINTTENYMKENIKVCLFSKTLQLERSYVHGAQPFPLTGYLHCHTVGSLLSPA
jgi:hypothetical protein